MLNKLDYLAVYHLKEVVKQWTPVLEILIVPALTVYFS